MRARTILVAVGLGLALACATTRIVESWTAPELRASDLSFHHVAAIAAMPDETVQRVAEDALAATATDTRVTPGYRLLSREDRADPERLYAVLQRNGIDGVITVRMIGTEERHTWVPGTVVYPGGYYGYWDSVGVGVYEPGYVLTDRFVKVETTLYDVANGRLLWGAVSETMNPSNVKGLIADIVRAAREDLAKQELLP